MLIPKGNGCEHTKQLTIGNSCYGCFYEEAKAEADRLRETNKMLVVALEGLETAIQGVEILRGSKEYTT